MKKTLIVAHADDEMLWFVPNSFDQIVICYLHHPRKLEHFHNVLNAYNDHPLKDKISLIGLHCSDLWRNNCKNESLVMSLNCLILDKLLKPYVMSSYEIYTHNEFGEYGHTDHISVHSSVLSILKSSISGSLTKVYVPAYRLEKNEENVVNVKVMLSAVIDKEVNCDLDLYEDIKSVYVKHGCWTWYNGFVPDDPMQFVEVKF